MAINTVWHLMDIIPKDKLVIVYHPDYGYKLREVTEDWEWYDENNISLLQAW